MGKCATVHNTPNASYQPQPGISCNIGEGYCEPLDSPACENSSSFEISMPKHEDKANTLIGIAMMITGTTGVGVVFTALKIAVTYMESSIYTGLGMVAFSSGLFLGYGAYELGASLNSGEGLGIVIYDMTHRGR